MRATQWSAAIVAVLALGVSACGDDTGLGASGGAGGEGGESSTGGQTAAGGGGEGGAGGSMPTPCEAATIVSVNETVGGTLDGAANVTHTTCAFGDLGPASGGEVVYQVTPEASGQLILDLTASGDAVVAVRTDCDDNGTELGCANLAAEGGQEQLVVPVTGGETYYVIVEGYKYAEGSFVLGIVGVPTPSCDAAQTLPDPGTVSGNTFGQPSELQNFCQPESSASGEEVYEVTAAVSGVLEINLTSAADLGLSVRNFCTDIQSERGCVNAAGSGLGTVETLTVPVTAEEVLYVVVDGTVGGAGGPYDLEILSRATSCGDDVREGTEECDDGNAADDDGCSATCTVEDDACAAATVLALPSTTMGDTSAGSNFTSTNCDGLNGTAPDLAYSFTPAVDGLVRIDLTSPLNIGFLLLRECDSFVTCRSGLGNGTETATVPLQAGKTYDLIVSGFNGASGSFTLDLTPIVEECGNGAVEGMEQCDDGNTDGGDGCSATCVAEASSCAMPIDVSSLPATLGGTTAAGNNDIELACGLFGYPETVFQVTPTIDGVLDVEFVSSGLNLAIQTTCGDNDADLFCGSGPAPQLVTVPASASDPVYFVVNGPLGPTYSLQVSERVPD
jgi:cysteine-rich repeat protein